MIQKKLTIKELEQSHLRFYGAINLDDEQVKQGAFGELTSDLSSGQNQYIRRTRLSRWDELLIPTF